MSTVFRVKRKLHDEPVSSLVIACKRPKTHSLPSDSDDLDVKTVAQFAGRLKDVNKDFHEIVPTVISPDVNSEFGKSYKRMSNDEIKSYLHKKPKWIDVEPTVEKIKVSKYENPKEKDNLAVNGEGTSGNVSEEKWMTFVDLEDTWSSDFPIKCEQDDKDNIDRYVYDLYYVEMDEDVWSDSKIFIQYPKNYDELYSDSEDKPDDSSDSNSESNWRNDYPDTDPFESDDESDRDDDRLYKYSVGDSSSSDDEIDNIYFEDEYYSKFNTFGRNYRKSVTIYSTSDSSESSSSSDEEYSNSR